MDRRQRREARREEQAEARALRNARRILAAGQPLPPELRAYELLVVGTGKGLPGAPANKMLAGPEEDKGGEVVPIETLVSTSDFEPDVPDITEEELDAELSAPPEPDALPEPDPLDPLEGIPFASSSAEELARSRALIAEDFDGVQPSGVTGFTKADVEAVLLETVDPRDD